MVIQLVLGEVSAYIALAFGLFFFLYAAKYYLSMLIILLGRSAPGGNGNNPANGNGGANHNHRFADKILWHFNNQWNNHHGDDNQQSRGVDSAPLVSIHLPFYNEKNVADRILTACSRLNYPNYEIVVVDDSTDETLEILSKWREKMGPPTIKIVHRSERIGFKGGALAEALTHTDPRAEYVIVFDADFIPPPDIIREFLWYFEMANKNHNGNHNHGANSDSPIGEVKAWKRNGEIAAVQGYQMHCLNRGENWLTRGVRVEYSGSYMVERVAEEFFGAMKMVAGSVFMVRADLLRKHGWSTSLTEDWDLTVRLYLDGYKVVFTPLVQAAAEIPSTVQRLAKQRMRWAEGHTFAVRKYFWRVLVSPRISWREKLEFLFFSPYYLQPLFLLLGTSFWSTAEVIPRALRLISPQLIPEGLRFIPFWTATLGWALVLFNLAALPLMGLTGLYMERTARRDFTGILSCIALSYVLTPFQAYAALKGLLEAREGVWVRTPKTGKITDLILKVRLRKVLRWVLPRGRRGLRRGALKEE